MEVEYIKLLTSGPNKQQGRPGGHDVKETDTPDVAGHKHMGYNMGSGQEAEEHAGYCQMAAHGDHGGNHAMMVANFRRRFWIPLITSIPILLLSPLIQRSLGLEK